MRPYNHPDNLDQNGQPKVSEDAWALNEMILDAAQADMLAWPSNIPTPKTFEEAFLALLREVKLLREAREEDQVGDFLAQSIDHEEYIPEDFTHWSGTGSAINTKTKALDSLALLKAERAAVVMTANATDLASAIALVNELKAKLNLMND